MLGGHKKTKTCRYIKCNVLLFRLKIKEAAKSRKKLYFTLIFLLWREKNNPGIRNNLHKINFERKQKSERIKSLKCYLGSTQFKVVLLLGAAREDIWVG